MSENNDIGRRSVLKALSGAGTVTGLGTLVGRTRASGSPSGERSPGEYFEASTRDVVREHATDVLSALEERDVVSATEVDTILENASTPGDSAAVSVRTSEFAGETIPHLIVGFGDGPEKGILAVSPEIGNSHAVVFAPDRTMVTDGDGWSEFPEFTSGCRSWTDCENAESCPSNKASSTWVYCYGELENIISSCGC